MDLSALWVTVGGVALAIGVNIYFFSTRRTAVAEPVAAPEAPRPPVAGDPAAARPVAGEPFAAGAPGRAEAMAAAPAAAVAQEVRITVRGGYDPSRIQVRAGQPVRLVFRREEVAGCSDTVLLPEWGIARRLPAGEDTVVEFTPTIPGEYAFTCGMQMMRGTIVVV